MYKFYSLLLLSGFMLVNSMNVSAQEDKAIKPNEVKEYRDLLFSNASSLGISKIDLNECIITDAYTDHATGITFMYIQQAYEGIRVFNTIISGAFKSGNFQSASGRYVNNLASKINTTTPVKTVLDAVSAAVSHLKLDAPQNLQILSDDFAANKKYNLSAAGIAKKEIVATLVFVASEDKQSVKLAWDISIDVAGADDWWNVRIDAVTGAFIEKNNWTVFDNHIHVETTDNAKSLGTGIVATDEKFTAAGNQLLPPPNVTSATYRVIPYPSESPDHAAFSNAVSPWLLAGATNDATTHGWHFDGTSNYTITRGNNVFAHLDRDNNNTPNATNNWPDTSTTAVPSLTFVHTLNNAVQPNTSVESKKAALDNLFYWNNIIHDVTYQYGFTEAAGNFQAANLGRGGTGNDYVSAHAQDANGYNNANFSTPNDGSSGRMQMYLWSTAPTLAVTFPAIIAGNYTAVENSFTAPNKLPEVGPVSGQVVWYDSAFTTHTACAASQDPSKLAGKIVLIDASSCAFIAKVKNAQNAGAIGTMLYYPNLLGMGGTDNTVVIPAVAITTATANLMLAQINAGTPVYVTLTGGLRKDGDFDNSIIVHEYGHGVSNRLTGGPANTSCLQNAEQGGEGWSDFLALMITTDWANTPLTAGPNPRPVGTYALDQPVNGVGIRRYPYSTNMTVQPLTYADVATNTAVHAVGEVWCTALWDMTWNIIQQEGSINPNIYNASAPGGNSVAFNLVMTGMKLQPCSPGFIDARNAILAADSLLYNYAHKCAIWSAFARRGMGYSASQGSSASAVDQTAAYDVPATLRIAQGSILQLPQSSAQTISHNVTCDCSALTNQVVRDTIPAGFTYISSSPAGATVSGNVVSFPASSFAIGETKTFSVTLQTPAGCTMDAVINDNRDGSTAGGFVSGGTSGWSGSTTRSHSPVTSWFSAEPTTATNNTLTSAAHPALAANNLSILSFWHYYNTERTYDGGVVEYSTNGTSWQDVEPFFLRGRYTTLMDGSTTLSGRRAYTGTNSVFTNPLVDLSSLGTSPVQIRFRSTSDVGVGGEGWFVDDVVRLNGCGGIIRTGAYTGAGVLQSSTITPVFVIQGALPLQMLNFDARAGNKNQVILQWKTAAEINVKDFDVEWSTNNSSWTTIATLNAKNQAANSYTTLHAYPQRGINFYRLKIKDIDNSYNFSETRTVNILSDKDIQPMLVPNPVTNDAVLYINSSPEKTLVKIYDAAGSLVQSITVLPGTQQVKINAAKLAAGMYIIETIGQTRHTTKMVIQK